MVLVSASASASSSASKVCPRPLPRRFVLGLGLENLSSFNITGPNMTLHQFTWHDMAWHPVRHVVLVYGFRVICQVALLRDEFQLPKLSFQSDLRRRAGSSWALPHISSVLFVYINVMYVLYFILSLCIACDMYFAFDVYFCRFIHLFRKCM